MTKQDIRKTFLAKRQEMPEAAFAQSNRQICDHFFAHVNLNFVNVLHTFLPIEKTKEPDTWMIIDRIRREFPHIRIAIPKINNQTSLMDNYFFEGLHQLEKNVWGIPEPKQGIPVPLEKIDLVLVPLLAVDKMGNRVGYGRGFYDKFLGQCPVKTTRVGLSFFEPIDRVDDVSQYDLPLHQVVTPNGVVVI